MVKQKGPTIVAPTSRIFVGRPPMGYTRKSERWCLDPWAAERVKHVLSEFYAGKKPVEVMASINAQFGRKRDARKTRKWFYSEFWSILRNVRLYAFGEYQSPKAGWLRCPDLAFVPEEFATILDRPDIKLRINRRLARPRKIKQVTNG